MISELSSVTSELLSKVLDASMFRHKLIADNIANNNTPGFKALDVNFESLLRAELGFKGELSNDNRVEEVLKYVEPQIGLGEKASMTGGDDQSLDHQMAEMAKNTLKYESLLKAMSLNGGIVSMAISGSRNR